MGAGIDGASIVNAEAVINVFAACEWDELSEDGRVWINAIIRETVRRVTVLTPCVALPATDTLRTLIANMRGQADARTEDNSADAKGFLAEAMEQYADQLEALLIVPTPPAARDDTAVWVEADKETARNFMFQYWPKWDAEYDGVRKHLAALLTANRMPLQPAVASVIEGSDA